MRNIYIPRYTMQFFNSRRYLQVLLSSVEEFELSSSIPAGVCDAHTVLHV